MVFIVRLVEIKPATRFMLVPLDFWTSGGQ